MVSLSLDTAAAISRLVSDRLTHCRFLWVLALSSQAPMCVVAVQADDALVAELRDQLQQQAADHAAQLNALQQKLAW
jgi:hypothetical protein